MSESEDSYAKTCGVTIVGQIGSIGGDVIGRDKLGIDPEQLVALLDARGVLRTAETAGLERRVVVSLAQRLRPEERLDFDQALAELERTVEIALDVVGRGQRGTNDDVFVGHVLALVAEKVRGDDLDGGSTVINKALADLEARHRRSQITLLEEGVKVDILRRDAAAVARHIERIVAVNHPGERVPWLREFRLRWDQFFADGGEKGNNFSLAVAIKLAWLRLVAAGSADERGVASHLLGSALATVGERDSGTEQLEEAVATFRTVLPERTRRRVPLDWASTLNNLGNALGALGERESGTSRLEEAVTVYRAALQERTRRRVPLDWATTQNNLGTALKLLGERQSSRERLEEAVAAYRGALQEWTRERAPLRWATAQNNLGSALQKIGELECGTERLEEAVAAYRIALRVRTRERVPLGWAMTQNNLGEALVTLGQRENRTARLEEAVAAIRAALQEWTFERAPYYHAVAQRNLASAEVALSGLSL